MMETEELITWNCPYCRKEVIPCFEEGNKICPQRPNINALERCKNIGCGFKVAERVEDKVGKIWHFLID